MRKKHPFIYVFLMQSLACVAMVVLAFPCVVLLAMRRAEMDANAAVAVSVSMGFSMLAVSLFILWRLKKHGRLPQHAFSMQGLRGMKGVMTLIALGAAAAFAVVLLLSQRRAFDLVYGAGFLFVALSGVLVNHILMQGFALPCFLEAEQDQKLAVLMTAAVSGFFAILHAVIGGDIGEGSVLQMVAGMVQTIGLSSLCLYCGSFMPGLLLDAWERLLYALWHAGYAVKPELTFTMDQVGLLWNGVMLVFWLLALIMLRSMEMRRGERATEIGKSA